MTALERWPQTGIPENPGAWLMATARNRAIDVLRRDATHDRKLAEVADALEADAPVPVERAAVEIEDDLLRLVFTCCHPVQSNRSVSATRPSALSTG